MAVSSAQLAVGATPVELTATDSGVDRLQSLLVVNTGGTVVYLGGPSVSTSTGLALAVGASLTCDLAGEQLFAVAASSGAVHVLRTGV